MATTDSATRQPYWTQSQSTAVSIVPAHFVARSMKAVRAVRMRIQRLVTELATNGGTKRRFRLHSDFATSVALVHKCEYQ